MVTACCARRTGVSSTPESPTSKSPRSTEASIDVKATCRKRGRRPRPRARTSAISTSNPRTVDGSFGSASTYGAPPSAPPPQTGGGGEDGETGEGDDGGTGGRGDTRGGESSAATARSAPGQLTAGRCRRPARAGCGGERSSRSGCP